MRIAGCFAQRQTGFAMPSERFCISPDASALHKTLVAGLKNPATLEMLGISEKITESHEKITGYHGVITSHHGVITSYHGVVTSHHGMKTSHHGMKTSYHSMKTSHHSVKTSYHGVKNSYHGVKTFHHSMKTSYHGVKTFHRSMITAHYGVMTSHHGMITRQQTQGNLARPVRRGSRKTFNGRRGFGRRVLATCLCFHPTNPPVRDIFFHL